MKKPALCFLMAIPLAVSTALAREQDVQSLKPLEPVLAKSAPKINAVLDDEAWSQGPAIDEPWVSYNPAYGERLPQRTEVYLAYDPDNLYFAFYCHDTEPGLIKTSLTKRDSMFSDDWVGFSLDASGSRQMGYECFVNPSGVQGDLQLTAAAGEVSAPDWVWHSAGRIVEDGYIVEIHIPLKSIRFSSGESRALGILFWRRISRLSMSGAWPAIKPEKGVFNSMNKIIYGRLDSQRTVELLPVMTYASSWSRLSPTSWSPADDARKLGLGLKYGLSSSITAEATFNPDFSQVESDAFQVTVNQRYPVFYSEKRPFFMDAGSLFQLSAQTGMTNLSQAVHTRFIVDPLWGLRLTGEIGRSSFGLLAAADRSPGLSWETDDENPFLHRNAHFWIGRGKYSLGGDNYIGALYSGREFAGGYNRALAGDLFLRFSKYHRILATYIFSLTESPDGGGRSRGAHFTLHYRYRSRNTYFSLMGEAADPGFRMDTAYYQRTGFRQAGMTLIRDFQPNQKKWPWLMNISPGITALILRDTVTGLDDKLLNLSLNLQFPLQGNISFGWTAGQEGWAGREYRKTTFNLGGTIQPVKWFYVHSCGQWGDSIYYSQEAPFLGDRLQWHINTVFQPTGSLNLGAEYIYCRFDRMDGSRVFDQDIIRTRLSYQFNRALFVRALVQYDGYYKRLLSDFLASFTLIPGTVVHLGYGSLHDKMEWVGGKWEPAVIAGRFYQNKQSLYFKVSYLFQF